MACTPLLYFRIRIPHCNASHRVDAKHTVVRHYTCQYFTSVQNEKHYAAAHFTAVMCTFSNHIVQWRASRVLCSECEAVNWEAGRTPRDSVRVNLLSLYVCLVWGDRWWCLGELVSIETSHCTSRHTVVMVRACTQMLIELDMETETRKLAGELLGN